MEIKKEIRSLIKKERLQLNSAECEQNSTFICSQLIKQDWYQKCNHILLYSATQNEVDLKKFAFQAWNDHKNLYFPKVFGDDMDFFKVDNFEQLKPGAFHILEPAKECSLFIPNQPAIILVPGVAFSQTGDRIGYGKGYYDRYLKRYLKFIYPIGIGYDMQVVKEWVRETSDVPMGTIITEKRKVTIYEISGGIV